jgi:hypothetical protein
MSARTSKFSISNEVSETTSLPRKQKPIASNVLENTKTVEVVHVQNDSALIDQRVSLCPPAFDVANAAVRIRQLAPYHGAFALRLFVGDGVRVHDSNVLQKLVRSSMVQPRLLR